MSLRQFIQSHGARFATHYNDHPVDYLRHISMELFLKAILLHTGKTTCHVKKLGHDLPRLFNKISYVASNIHEDVSRCCPHFANACSD